MSTCKLRVLIVVEVIVVIKMHTVLCSTGKLNSVYMLLIKARILIEQTITCETLEDN